MHEADHNRNHSPHHKRTESYIIQEFPQVRTGTTVKDLEEMLLANAHSYNIIDYIYVTDDSGRLVGVLSIKELFKAPRTAKVDGLMKTNLVVAHPHTHRERLAYLALAHGLKAIPVVDDEKRFYGIVPYDVLLHIFNDEVHEDFIQFGGMFHRVGKEYTMLDSPPNTMIKSRLPWLVVGVLGGVVTASIVSGFESVLSSLITLAAFTPVLAYLSDAVGTQSETLAVRGIALNPRLSMRTYLLKELQIGALLALICSGLLGACAYLGWGNSTLAAIVGLSMFISIIAAILISTGLPFILRYLKLDPALASGPLATMVSDVATITIYFTIATMLL